MGKLAIALGGGGTRGAYQMGVWKAIRELGIQIDIAVGTSVGALMGAMMAQNDYEAACKIWEELDESFVINADMLASMKESPKKARLTYLKHFLENGGADITPLENNLDIYIDEERLRKSPVDFGLVTVEYPTLKSVELSKGEIPQGKLADYIIASASCFPAFKAKDIDGVRYVDGGYYDNVPINLAFKMGADSVIAIDLQSLGIVRPPKDPMLRDKVAYISSHWDLGNFLSFDKELVHRNMSLGYNETMKAFGGLDGDVYTYFNGEELINYNRNYRRYQQTAARLNLGAFKTDSSPVTALVNKRIINKIGIERKNSWHFFTALAELCGEVFEMEATTIYHFEEYNKLLCEKLENCLGELEKVSAADGIKEQLESVKEMSKGHIAALLYRKLAEDAISFNPNLNELRIISLALPAEIASAFYMIIINMDQLTGAQDSLR